MYASAFFLENDRVHAAAADCVSKLSGGCDLCGRCSYILDQRWPPYHGSHKPQYDHHSISELEASVA